MKSTNFRWAHDSWLSRGGLVVKYDKLEHALAYFVGSVFLLWLGLPYDEVFFFLFLAGVMWEIKDAHIPFETYGKFGGDGFSWRDIIANLTGIFAGFLVVWFFSKLV